MSSDRRLNPVVVVAVGAVRGVQVPVHPIVDVIAVRYGRVAAARAVPATWKMYSLHFL